MYRLLFALFIVSRLIFLNSGNVFFDSKEYISRWSDPNFFQALTSGHPPLHSGYVAIFWPIFQLLRGVGVDSVWGVLVFQTLVAAATVFVFHKIVMSLFSKELAFHSALLFSILPIFWIVNESVMMETVYLFFWILSLCFLTLFIKSERNQMKWLCLASLFWVFAFLTHTVVIMWIPLFCYLVWTKSRKKFLLFILFGVISIVTASIINAFLLSISFKTNLGGGLYWLYAAKFGEHAYFQPSIETALRYGRNWLQPLGYNNSWIVLTFALSGFILAFKKNLWLLGLAVLWIGPSFITNQWWDSLFYGRHSLVSSLMLVILAVSYINKRTFWLISGLVLCISLSALSLIKKPIPYLQVAKHLNNLTPGGLVVDSHFARPQTDGEYFGQMLFVDEPGWNINETKNIINGYLKYDKPVFVTGQALSEPYGLYSGPFLHGLSLSYKNQFILGPLVKEYNFRKIIDVDRQYNLDIYQISSGSGQYPQLINQKNSRRRVDWLDPLRIAAYFLTN